MLERGVRTPALRLVSVTRRSAGPGRQRGKRHVFILASLALALLAACGAAQQERPLEERAKALDKQFICPVCPSETIDQAQATLAKQMRAIVRERLADGESEQEITDYFVSAYGELVLAEPPKSGFSLTVWLVPPVALTLGAMGVVLAVRALRRRQAMAPNQAPGDQTESGLEKYLELVDEELQDQGSTHGE